MMAKYDLAVIKAVALCFKPYLKPEEAMIYCNLEHSHFARRCEQYGVYKNNNGYYKRQDLDKIVSGEPPLSMDERLKAFNLNKRK
jgi:hypothetical protein